MAGLRRALPRLAASATDAWLFRANHFHLSWRRVSLSPCPRRAPASKPGNPRGKAAIPARVAALYTRDATHQSALIAKIYPELGRLSLQGHHEIAVYASRGFSRYTELRFEILTITETGDRAAVEYRRHSNIDGANPAHVLELIEWRTL